MMNWLASTWWHQICEIRQLFLLRLLQIHEALDRLMITRRILSNGAQRLWKMASYLLSRLRRIMLDDWNLTLIGSQRVCRDLDIESLIGLTVVVVKVVAEIRDWGCTWIWLLLAIHRALLLRQHLHRGSRQWILRLRLIASSGRYSGIMWRRSCFDGNSFVCFLCLCGSLVDGYLLWCLWTGLYCHFAVVNHDLIINVRNH